MITKLDANDVAVAIAQHEDALGAIVVILTTSGELDVSMVAPQDEDASKPLVGIQEAIRRHCDDDADYRRLDPPGSATGST